VTRDEVLAELDRRFDEFMAEEVEQMRASGLGEALIAAVVAENRERYAEKREAAAEYAVGPVLH
jgi:hypothetical protein